MRWLASLMMALFVAGGLAGGAIGVRNLSGMHAQHVQSAQPTPVPTPVIGSELAPHPALRDFDESPPPFAPAGQSDDLASMPGPQSAPAAATTSASASTSGSASDSASASEPASASSGHMNILLMGIDQRPDEAVSGGDPGRTDSMVLVSIDFDSHSVSMVSIPRDGFVVIPGHGNERVNAAYTYGELDQAGGGPALAERTVEQLFGVRIDRYALIDIHSMQQVIDDLGGVWIDNPRRLVDTAYPTDDYRTIKIDIPAGRQLMDGVTAVEYARTRHPDSDYGREDRQQQVLLAIRDRALQLDVLPRLPELVPEVLNLVHTDISLVDAIQLANFGRGLDSSEIARIRPDPSLTPSYTGPGGAAYINLTTKYRSMVRAMLTDPQIAAEQADINVYNAGAPVGSGGRAAHLLGAAGLIVDQVTTAPRVPSTRIEAGGGARKSAELVAHLLGLSGDALVVHGESSDVKVLLGPDVHLPPA